MYCPRCGSSVPDGSYRCTACNTFLRNAPPTEQTQLGTPPSSGAAYPPPPIGRNGAGTHAPTLLSGLPLSEQEEPGNAPPPNYAQPPTAALPMHYTVPGQPMPPSAPTIAAPAGRHERQRKSVANTGAVVGFCVTLLLTVTCVLWYVNSHRPRNYTLTDKMRLLRVGDEYRYKVTMKMNLPPELDFTGSGSRPVTGSYSVKIQSMKLGERYMPAETTRSTLSGLDLSEGSLTYFEQDPSTRDMVKLADVHGAHHPFRRVVQREGCEPGTFREHLTGGYRYLYDNGDTEEERIRVVGVEPVQTPLGKFMAWRVEQTDTMNGSEVGLLMPNQITSTVWIVPQLGREVKATAVVESKLLPPITFTMTLESTNVPLF